MNKTFKDVISGSPKKGIVTVLLFFILILPTTSRVGAESEIKDYIPTVEITLIDGDETKEYLVYQQKISKVLDYIDVKLEKDEILNKDMDAIVQDGDILEIYKVEEKEEEAIEEIAPRQVVNNQGLNLFTTEITQEGVSGQQKSKYKVIYHNGVEVSRELIQSDVIQAPIDQVTSTGVVQPGAYFTGRLTTYGGDCVGCSGGSASGLPLPTSGVNGNGTAKLCYQGQYYYCLAADPSIPFGTIIEITNHNLNIESTAYGIVVDRGGAIKGNKIDIYNGSEKGATFFTGGTSYHANFRIVSVGSGRAYFWK